MKLPAVLDLARGARDRFETLHAKVRDWTDLTILQLAQPDSGSEVRGISEVFVEIWARSGEWFWERRGNGALRIVGWDAERGILLRATASLEGDLFQIEELQSVVFDTEPPPDVSGAVRGSR